MIELTLFCWSFSNAFWMSAELSMPTAWSSDETPHVFSPASRVGPVLK